MKTLIVITTATILMLSSGLASALPDCRDTERQTITKKSIDRPAGDSSGLRYSVPTRSTTDPLGIKSIMVTITGHATYCGIFTNYKKPSKLITGAGVVIQTVDY